MFALLRHVSLHVILPVFVLTVTSLDAWASDKETQMGESSIHIWYGNTQSFGGLGNPVPAINILGNVSPSKGLVSLTYSLNGAAQETLSRGPDDRRLERAGDFNADIPYKSLLPGTNRVVVSAFDGFVTVRETVRVNYTAGQTWPLPFSANWSGTSALGGVSQVLDGLWGIQSGAVRPLELGYDRFIAFGDQSWSDYEITVPITILGLDSSGFAPPSNGCGVGFLMRWPGHSDLPASLAGRQPKTGYLPLGALGWNEWTASGQKLRMLGNNIQVLDQDSTGRVLAFNTQYIFKMRVETVPGNGGLYKMKVWEAGSPEPVGWDLLGQEAPSDPQRGSVLLVAHHVDALFGNVTIVPTKTTVPSSIVSDDFNAPTINTALWNVVNPLGDATFSVTGVNTQDAWVNIAVPGGLAHEPWTAGNNAPRLIQPANDTDFEVEAKFESGLTQRFQLQGIIAQQSSTSFIRFEFYSDGAVTRMFVASLVNGVATTRLNSILGPNDSSPLYMRVKRIGDGWSMRYSLDGTSWTNAVSFNHSMNLTGIGPYSGNAGSPSPAMTGNIDYFFNTASPIVPEDGTQLSTPVITQNPLNATVNVGQTATFTVVATGSAPLAYRWQKNGTNIAGATSASYTTPPVIAGDNGAQFRCIVSNAAGSDTSANATLTVTTAPVVTQEPSNATVNVGQTATFTVVATGSAPLAYRWQKNGTNIAGATSASYTTPPVIAGDNGAQFRCIVSNAAGSDTSANAVLTVAGGLPTITQNPANATVNLGQTATFTVVATGSAPLAYRWQKNGTNISGATSASYTTPAATAGDNGAQFRCIVSNASGSDTSANATLTVSIAGLPVITQNPANAIVNPGQTATFTITVTGTAPFTYRWQKNGSNISGSNSASYTTPPANAGADGNVYRCIVTNALGSDTSANATLAVRTAPVITQQPSNDTANVGQTATFSVVATGTAPLAYQWRKNGNDINGATSASYTTPPVVAGDHGALFRCFVSNAAGSVQSANASLAVNVSPTITLQPVHDTVVVGQRATFVVAATGTAPLSYRWQRNQVNIPGATSASYTTPHAVSSDNGARFRCIVSNAAGNATSSEARLVLASGGNRVANGLLALYLFNEGSGDTVSDVSNVLPRLDLAIKHPQRTEWHAGYLTVVQKTVIKSAGPATKIIAGSMLTNALSVEAWVRPECDNPPDSADCSDEECVDQHLARIVSVAKKHTMHRRNFSLDTKDGKYIGRVRTTVTDNQVRPNATTDNELVVEDLTHLLYTRSSDGTARLYINGDLVKTVNVGGNLSTWDQTYPLSIAGEANNKNPWYGDLHLVAMYGRALSSSEVDQNYAAGPDPEVGGPSSSMPGHVKVLDEVPLTYGLSQNYPNPFNPSTRIRYAIPQAGFVTLKLYDVLGREVRELLASHHDKGTYEITMEGADLSSGVYLYRLQAGEFVSTRRLLMLK